MILRVMGSYAQPGRARSLRHLLAVQAVCKSVGKGENTKAESHSGLGRASCQRNLDVRACCVQPIERMDVSAFDLPVRLSTSVDGRGGAGMRRELQSPQHEPGANWPATSSQVEAGRNLVSGWRKR